MSSDSFVYWLQGYFELSSPNKGLSSEQCKIIQDHIALVLKKETPDREQPSIPFDVGSGGVSGRISDFGSCAKKFC